MPLIRRVKERYQVKMAEECTHDCSTCSANCSSRNGSAQKSLREEPNQLSDIKHVIAVVSGKGGVGKSLVSCMLAVVMNRRGYQVGILDADVTGPSVPKAFGLKGEVTGDEHGMIPPRTKTGIDVMSVNLMLDDEKRPVVWRGSLIAGTVKQFWTDTIWNDTDLLIVDCPPGTGDVPLTLFQSVPLDGIIIVSSPQDLVSMIVSKAANMARMMNIPVLGLVENMSYAVCPDCGRKIEIFGASHIGEIADEFGFDVLAKLPIDPKLAALCDRGMIELMENDLLENAADMLEKKLGLGPDQ